MKLVLAFLLALFSSAVIGTTISTSASSKAASSDSKLETNPCTPGTKIYSFTGKIESFKAPRGCIVVMALWGAGGSNSPRGKFGGGGGYIRGAIIGEDQMLYVLVGEGAVGEVPNDTSWPGQGPFFGGGGTQGNYCGHAGGGGGRTQISLSPNAEDVDGVLLVAGGGGGAGTCPESFGGSGGGRDDVWGFGTSGGACSPGVGLGYGKGGLSGRPHNNFFNGHNGGDMGGGGGGGFYGGGAGEGHCDHGSGGGGGSSYWNKDFITALEIVQGNGPSAGLALTEYGVSAGLGATCPNCAGGHGLAMLNWYPDPNFGKNTKAAVSG